jgi:uncharacterized protein with HEPN domain
MSSRSPGEGTQDILSAIASIQNRIADMNFDEFSQHETVVKAVLYDL